MEENSAETTAVVPTETRPADTADRATFAAKMAEKLKTSITEKLDGIMSNYYTKVDVTPGPDGEVSINIVTNNPILMSALAKGR